MPEYHLSVVGLPGHCRFNFWPSFKLQAIQCMNAQGGENGAAEWNRDTEERADTAHHGQCPRFLLLLHVYSGREDRCEANVNSISFHLFLPL